MTELLGGYSVMVLVVPDEFDWQKIESASSTEFNVSQRDQLTDAVGQYLRDLSFEKSNPSSKDVRRHLKAIGRHSRGLAEALAATDTASEAAMNNIWPWARNVDPSIVKALLWDLSGNANQMHQSLWRRGGRPRHSALAIFTLNVREIWRDAGNERTGCHWDAAKGLYAGRLLDLINSLITQVPDAEPPKARTICKIVTT